MSATSAKSETVGDRIYLRIYDYETKEFSGLTTYHGLVRIYNSTTWPSRIFWVVVVLSCLSLFMIHSGFLLLGYHSKPTLFQVNVVVPEEGILFPDVTICNYNPVFTSKLKDWNMTESVLRYVLQAYLDDIEEDIDDLHSADAEFQEYAKDFFQKHNKSFHFPTFFKETGPTCSDLVLSCSFGGELIEDCCSESELILTDFGQCVRFSNRVAQRRQWFSGSPYGWQFLLDGKNHLRTDVLPTEFADIGVKIFVHEDNRFPSLRANGISVPPGTTLYAGINVKNVTLLPRTDWGMCQKDWDPAIHGQLMIPFDYSSSHCEFNCHMQRTMGWCGCVPLANTLSDQVPICTPLEIYQCHQKLKEKESTPCHCDVKCEEIEYDMQMSYANLAARNVRTYRKEEEEEFTKEYIKGNLALVNVYMREISFEKHEQQKQLQTADLLSNIAGSMGLFLGMSTVTLLEIFIYLFKSVWGTINGDRQKQFLEAMIEEEENGQNQDLIITEEVVPEDTENEESADHLSDYGNLERRRRISIAPNFKFRRPSAMIIKDDEEVPPKRRSISVAPLLSPPRLSLTPQHQFPRKHSVFNLEGVPELLAANSRRSFSVAPRKSVVHLETGDGHTPSTSRRGSSVNLLAGAAGGRKLSIQPSEDGIQLSFLNSRGRRKSSVTHLKGFKAFDF